MTSFLRLPSALCLAGCLAASIVMAQPPAAQPGEAPVPAAATDSDALPNPGDVTPAEAAQILLDRLEPAKQRTQDQARLRFNFSGTPWKVVFEWFCEEAELAQQFDQYPPGTVNFSDPTRSYSVSEAQDLLNRLLLDRGYAFVRRGRMAFLVDLEAQNAAKLISEMAELVTLEELDKRGRSDIVSCVFALGSMTPDQAKEQLPQLIGPSGRVIVLDGARQAKVTETVGKLLAIREVVSASAQEVVELTLRYRGADELLALARPLLDLEPGENTSDDIKISVGLLGDKIYATGLPAKLAVLSGIVDKADRAVDTPDSSETVELLAPEFRSYTFKTVETSSVFDVLQTMLADDPVARIAIEPATKSIILYARPDAHEMATKLIAKMEGEGEEFKVLTLRQLEPAQAVLAINKYFGITDEGGDGPVVDGDPATGKLWVRGTPSEIAQVEKLILGLEGEDPLGDLGGKIRVLPYTGSTAQDVLMQAEALWPAMGMPNRIRSMPARGFGDRGGASGGMKERKIDREVDRDKPPAQQTRPTAERPLDARNGRSSVPKVRYLVAENNAPAAGKSGASREADGAGTVNRSDLRVQVTSAGIIVACDDPAALDAFQSLVERLAPPQASASDLPTIFWLKYAKADATAELVAAILGGGDSSMASLTDSVMGGGGMGGMLGGLMGMAGGGGGASQQSSSKSILTTTGSVTITADNRLNALFVQANPIDMSTIEMILEKVDRMESPEDVELVSKPMLIPVYYQTASDVANVVKEVLGDRIAGAQSSGRGGGGGNQQQQAAEFMAAALRGGGRGGRGGTQGSAPSEPVKINIAVDERSNSLIVTATPQDFLEVEALVKALDEGGQAQKEMVEPISLPGGMNAEAMVAAIEAVLGTKVETANPGEAGRASPAGTNNTPTGDQAARIEAFRAQMRAGGFGGGRGGAGAGGFGGGRGGGGAGPGGGGRGGAAGGGGRGGGGGGAGGRGGR